MRDLALLTILVGAVFLACLGQRPFAVPSEARYVELGREMVVTGDLVTPRLNGVKYFEKPPLYYWVEAGALRLFGLSESAARLPSVLFGLLGVLCTFLTTRALYDRRAAWFSALVLATTLLYFYLSRLVLLDMALGFFFSATLMLFALATQAPSDQSKLWRLMYAMAAGAVMTKGLVGVLLPGLIIFIWLAMTRRWHQLRFMRLGSGAVIFLLLAAPWHLLAGRETPEFYWFYFIHEHVLRFTTDVHDRYQPAWFFPLVLVVGFFPWTAFLPQAVGSAARRWWRDRDARTELLLLLWPGVVIGFFSLSSSKHIPYILPAFPPLAILTGKYLAGPERNGARWGFGVLAATAGLLGLASAGTGMLAARLGHEVLARDVAIAGHTLWLAAAGFVVLALVVPALRKRHGTLAAVVGIAAIIAAEWMVVDRIAGRIQAYKSVKELALTLKPMLVRGDRVVSYYAYYQDLPVYLERTVGVVISGSELEFGTTIEDTSDWMLSEQDFWKRWSGSDRHFVVLKLRQYDEFLRKNGVSTLTEIARTRHNILIANRPP